MPTTNMGGATSVGQIGLDLVVNQNQFNKQMAGIQSLAKKAGAALAGAFATKKLVEFGKKCVDLGSDLEEVQNVVDVTFPKMTARVDEFAKNAAASFGLSETMAKHYSGTFGSMAKAFGFAEEAAFEMGSTLTGLAGDVASFYNITQDEAYTKLKSVFTGETESLKDLGVVMTQAALDSFALANGFGKTTQAMSEQEKIALRYAFVQDKLSAAAGDFSRTSAGWANQVRILKLQMESFMATIGQGFINLLTPVLKAINIIIGKIITLANAFKAFTELITGKGKAKNSQDTLSQIAGAGAAATESVGSAAKSAEDLAAATNSAGDAATETAKKMRQLMGFDVINKLNDTSNTSSGSGGSGGSGTPGGGGAAGDTFDFGELATGGTVLDETSEKFQKIIEKVKELARLFKEGFELGFGNSEANIQRIQKACENIGSTLLEIFTDEEVVRAAENLVDSIALNLGKISGSAANIGIAIVTNLTEGIAKSLEEQKEFIKKKISSILTLEADWWNVTGDFAVAFGNVVSEALTSDAAVQITSNITSILTQCFLDSFELVEKIKLDVTKMVLDPFTENADAIEKAIENTLSPIATITGTFKKAFRDAFSDIGEVYDDHISPMLATLREGFSDTFGKVLKSYNDNIAPVLDKLAKEFDEVYDDHIRPAMSKIKDAFGPVIDIIEDLYKVKLKPLMDWCTENIMPILAPIFEKFGKVVLDSIGQAADIVGDFAEVLGGVAKVIDGILTLDFSKVGDGLKQVAGGIKDLTVDILFRGKKDQSFTDAKSEYDKVKDETATKTASAKKESIFETVLNTWNDWKSGTIAKTVYAETDEAYKKLKEKWDGWKSENVTKAAKGVIDEKFDKLKEKWDGWKSNTITKTIKGATKKIYTDTKEKWDKWKSKSITKTIKGATKKSYTDTKGKWDKWKSKSITATAKGVAKKNFNSLKKSWNSLKDKTITIKAKVSGAIDNLKKLINQRIIDPLNKNLIGFINTFSPKKVKKIPRLAQGGFVKKNTPQLAVIGDNRHQGEVVAPEDKLEQMALHAAQMSNGTGGSTELITLIKEIIMLLKTLNIVAIDEESLRKYFITQTNANTKQRGKCELIV